MAVRPSFDCGYFSPGANQGQGSDGGGTGRRWEPWGGDPDLADPEIVPGGPRTFGGGGGGGPGGPGGPTLCSYPVWECKRTPVVGTWYDCIGPLGAFCKCRNISIGNCESRLKFGPCGVLNYGPGEFGTKPACEEECPDEIDRDCDWGSLDRERTGGPTTGQPWGPGTQGPGASTGPGLGPGPSTPPRPPRERGPVTGGGTLPGQPFGPVTQGPGASTGPGLGPGPSTPPRPPRERGPVTGGGGGEEPVRYRCEDRDFVVANQTIQRMKICVSGTGPTYPYTNKDACINACRVGTVPTGPFQFEPKWKCIERRTRVQGLGTGTVIGPTINICVSGFDSTYFYNTKQACEAECTNVIPPEQPQLDTRGTNQIPNSNNNTNTNDNNTTNNGNTNTTPPESIDPELQLPQTENIYEAIGVNQDPDTSLVFRDPLPFDGNIVHNILYRNIFNEYIHRSILYVIENINSSQNWDTLPLSDLTADNLEKSLNPELVKDLRKIKSWDNKPVSFRSFLYMVKSKLLSGELDSIDTSYIKKLANQPPVDIIYPTKTTNKEINTLKAFAYLEQRMIPLDPTKDTGNRRSSIVPLYKTLATDLEKSIPVTINGNNTKYYINDDDIVVGRANLKITDGDYIVVGVGANQRRFYLQTEKDHAFVVSDFDRAVALNLLDGNPNISLTASSNASSLVEFTYNLSSTRKDFYFLKLTTESVLTNKKSPYVDTTIASYQIMPTDTEQDMNAINNYIKFKSNHHIFNIYHDDLILDHMLQASSITLTQDDIRFDGHAKKTNKTVPLLVRQIPWYIIIYPTNKNENNTFLLRSKLNSLTTASTGIIERRLNFNLSLNRELYDPNFTPTTLVDYNLNYPEENVFGQLDVNSRKVILNKQNNAFSNGYINNEKPATREKTGIRVAYEIVKEVSTNYVLDRGLTTFDLFSRMKFKDFTKFSINLNKGFYDQIKNGIFGASVYSVTKYSGEPYLYKTALKRRSVNYTSDTYNQVKATNNGYFVDPPTETEKPKLRLNKQLPYK
jgi:hypothetical protein